jgi:hypothetical protein
MGGSITIIDRNDCTVEGKFLRGDEQFGFLVKNSAEGPKGFAEYRSASFPVLFVRP